MTARANLPAFVASRRLPVWRAGCVFLLFAAWLASAPLWAEAPHHEFTKEQREHWAFQKVRPVDPPKVRNARWVKTSIDAFVLAELEKKNLVPAPEADKALWLRRASLDLIGLPPSPAEVHQFLRDQSSRAYEHAVDRLLSSPHYGERWARHWLDLARYAESEGFKADETRPNAWRYRDYVIRSFNDDKPYDRFLREQIAGDELWPDNPEALIATGFNRHYPDESNARNLMQRRQEILNDITDTVGAVFTGLTYACARCHNHKWDPILQADYYRLQAYFANTAANDNIVLAPPEAVRRHAAQLANWSEKTQVIRDAMEEIERPHREAIIKDYVEKYPDEIQTALNKPATERNAFECQMVAKAMLYLDPQSHQYLAPVSAVTGRFKIGEKERWQDLKTQLDEFAATHPGKLPIGTGMAEVTDGFPATHILRRGIYDAPRDEVQPGFLTLLEPVSRAATVAKGSKHASRRTELANLLADPQNPLTARVMVNRVWHYHFGRGLAGSPSDFGIKGEPPTHPALLDWLATEFVRSGWSIKHLHRLIMTSAVYQQSSRVAAPGARSAKRAGDLAMRVDPDNKLLWHFPRTRLEGETIRDAALLVSGRLNPKPGGPSIFPELPSGMESRGGWKVNEDVRERDRRSVYVFVRRNTRYPLFESFDMPDTHESCARRNVTTSPVQALALLNSKLTLEWAQSFAGRVLAAAGTNPERQIDIAWQLAYARHPDAQELALAREFLTQQARLLGERQAGGEALALPAPSCELPRAEQGAALVDFCHALLNSNEFVYRD